MLFPAIKVAAYETATGRFPNASTSLLASDYSSSDSSGMFDRSNSSPSVLLMGETLIRFFRSAIISATRLSFAAINTVPVELRGLKWDKWISVPSLAVFDDFFTNKFNSSAEHKTINHDPRQGSLSQSLAV